MSKPEKKALVPALRFPEFQDKGGWKTKQLGKLSIIVRGGSPRPIDAYLARDINGLNWLKIGDVDKESKYVTRTEDRVKDSALSKTRVVNPGDLIMSNSMSFGRPYILEITTCIHDGWIAVTEINRDVDRDYLYYFILSNSAQVYFTNAAAGGGIKNLNADIIKMLPSAFPEQKDEQQKIADFLSSIDDLITAQTQKLVALKAHKKGLMQQLFPAEGETVPRLRFPEFRNGGGWVQVQLGRIGELVSGLTYSPDDVRDEGLLVLRSSNVQNGAISLEDNVYVRPDVKGANLSKPDDILICVRNGSKPLIGKNALIPEAMPLCTHGAFMTVFRSSSARFVFQLFQTSAYEKQVAADLGATINSINGNQLKKYKFHVPESKEEQQKIADCLSSIDELITAQSQKIEVLKNHKKGLMQQLFPSMDEVDA